jgi:hypothetical protein
MYPIVPDVSGIERRRGGRELRALVRLGCGELRRFVGGCLGICSELLGRELRVVRRLDRCSLLRLQVREFLRGLVCSLFRGDELRRVLCCSLLGGCLLCLDRRLLRGLCRCGLGLDLRRELRLLRLGCSDFLGPRLGLCVVRVVRLEILFRRRLGIRRCLRATFLCRLVVRCAQL